MANDYPSWDEVIAKPEYQELSASDKLANRQAYFNDVIKPQLKPNEVDANWTAFSADADQMEGIKPPDNNQPTVDNTTNAVPGLPGNDFTQYLADLDPAVRDAIIAKGQRDKGFLAAMNKGRFGSTTAELTKAYLPDTASGRGVAQAQADNWQPETRAERIGQSVGSITADLPLYAAGAAIGGAGGSFALPAALKQLAMEKEKAGGQITASDLANLSPNNPAYDVLKAMPKEWIKGELLGLAGQTSGAVADKLGGGVLAKTAGEVASLPVETAALLGADRVLDGKPITTDNALETALTIAALKGSGAFPGAVKDAFNSIRTPNVDATNVDTANIDNTNPNPISNPNTDTDTVNPVSTDISDKPAELTAQQIEAQRISDIQDKIVDQQVKANYKDGKTPDQILQIGQIPKEYRPYVLDPAEGGGFKFKPEVLQKVDDVVNTRDPFVAQQYEDVLPNPLRDMGRNEGQRLADQLPQAQDNLKEAQDNLDHFDAQAPSLHEQHMTNEINDRIGDYRRYERAGAARDKMDQVIDHAMSVLTPEEKMNIALEPSTLMDHIDAKESGYDDLSPAYQDAVKKEITAKLMKKTGFIPPEIINEAQRLADYRVAKERKGYEDAFTNADRGVKAISNDPDFQAHTQRLNDANKTDEQRAYEARNELNKVDKNYNKKIQDAQDREQAAKQAENERINPELMATLGQGEEFGAHSINAEDVYGKEHIDDLRNFFRISPDEAINTLDKANYLDMAYNPKWSVTNSYRVIKNKLGDGVKRLFIDPIRQAEHDYVTEVLQSKEYWKSERKNFTAQEREEIGAHLLDQQEQSRLTLQRMKIKAKSFEELTEAQQEIVTHIRDLLDVVFTRINKGREMSGLEPLDKVDNYFTFLRKFNIAEELGYDTTTIPSDVMNSDILTDYPSKSFAFRFGKDRVKSTRELETDAFYVLDKYLSSALKVAHMTPVVGRLRNILDHATDFQIHNRNAYDYLSSTLDYVAGKKLVTALNTYEKIGTAVASRITKNVATFTLCYNVKSMFSHVPSIINTAVKLSPAYMAKGLNDFMSSDMRDFAQQNSKVLKARMNDITVEEMKNGFYGKAGKAYEKTITLGTLPLRYLDLKVAQATWLSAYRYGKEFSNFSDKEAILFADDTVITTRGSAARIDLAPIQRTPIGKMLTLFNTYTINNFNFLLEDVAGVKTKNELIASGVSKEGLKNYTGDDYTDIMIGKDNYNVYQKSRMVDKSDVLSNMMTYVVGTALMSTVYEACGLSSPNPAPISAAYQAINGQSWIDALQGKQPTKKQGQLTDALWSAFKELVSIVPICGRGIDYGGNSLFGAVGGLMMDVADTLAGKPEAKSLPYLAAKFAGIPGGQQIHKILVQMDRDQKQEVLNMRHITNPGYYNRQNLRNINPGYYQQKKEVRKQSRGY